MATTGFLSISFFKEKIDVDGLPFETYDDDKNDDEGEHSSQLPNYKRVKARIIRSVFFNKVILRSSTELIMLLTP